MKNDPSSMAWGEELKQDWTGLPAFSIPRIITMLAFLTPS